MKKALLSIVVALIICCGLSGCQSKAAKTTKKLINNIGSVSLESGEAIAIAEASYAALSPEDKSAIAEAKQQLDLYNDEYSFLVAAQQVEEEARRFENENSMGVVVETDYELREITFSIISDIEAADIEYYGLRNRGAERASCVVDEYDAIQKILDSSPIDDVTISVLLLQADRETVIVKLVNGKVNTNTIQAITDSKPNIRNNADFDLFCWGDDKDTVLHYVKEEVDEDVGTQHDDAITVYDKYLWGEEWCLVSYKFNADGQLYTMAGLQPLGYGAVSTCLLTYNEVKEVASKEYGDPTADGIQQLSALALYTDNETALRFGYIRYVTIWETETTEVVIFTDVASGELAVGFQAFSRRIHEDAI